jgi:hypothetical protein
MKTIKVKSGSEIPNNFTGIVEWLSGTKHWYKEGKCHREVGPAVEFLDGTKYWYLEGKQFLRINLNNYVILDYYQGNYNLTWYRLLDKDEVIEYPDIPGLIIK